MKTTYTFFVAFFCLSLTYSQIGINTTIPNALLDIQASNQATPSNTDGILIPKVDNFPATNPTINQDGMMVFATGSGTPSKGFYFWDNAKTLWKKLDSELEKLDEGNGPGWRLAGRNPSNYGIIGLRAIDFSYSNLASSTRGATGENSFAWGLNARASSIGSIALAGYSNASGPVSVAIGYNAIASEIYSIALGSNAFSAGAFSTSLGQEAKAMGLRSVAIGTLSTANGSYARAFGSGTHADAFHSTAMGFYNIGGGNASFWLDTDPLFEIGNGTILTPNNALTVLKNGTIIAPSFDISEITDNKALITKEYAEANFTTSSSTITAPTLMSGYSVYGSGYRIPGYYFRNGRVYFEGLLFKTGVYTAAEVIFNLPIGYRPDARILCQSGQQSNSIRIDILPNGDVIYITGGTQNFVSLEGISFRVN